MSDERDAADEFGADLAGLNIMATIENPDDLTDYRRSVEYGRDGRPLHGEEFDDSWFDANEPTAGGSGD